jgi:hypothetical protein
VGILLTATTDKLQVITTGAQALAVHASWIDYASGASTPGRTNTAIVSATTSDVVASPAASTYRNVKLLTIRNKDASASDTVTVQHTDGTTIAELWKVTLKAGYTLCFAEGQGFFLLDASGGRVQTPLTGRFLGTSVLTSASANFTTGPETNTIKVRGCAGGGGGAGCTSVAAAASAGGGGGAGGVEEKVFAVTPNTAYAYTCGAGGVGQSALAGTNGTDSTFVVGATTVTAKGGTGAVVATALTTLSSYKGGAGGVAGTNGDLNSAGSPGENGHITVVATPVGAAGGGGSGPFGAGGDPISAVGNGNNGKGFGAGGGGAMTGASVARTGGSATAGCWIVDEYS